MTEATVAVSARNEARSNLGRPPGVLMPDELQRNANGIATNGVAVRALRVVARPFPDTATPPPATSGSP